MNYRMMLLACVLMLVVSIPAAAQTSQVVPYAWDAGDLALAYPLNWDAPLPVEDEGRVMLQLAQALVDTPPDQRPPGIPFITLTLIPAESFVDVEPNLAELLEQALRDMGIRPSGALLATLFETQGVMVSGSSGDGLLYGLGQATQLPDESVLLVTGRGLLERQDAFRTVFEQVVSSLVLGANSAPNLPTYGVLWRAERTISDGEDAFLDLVTVVYGADAGLYALDRALGVIRFDPQTGAVLENMPFEDLLSPSDMAVNADGRVFVADTECGCVYVLDAGSWRLGLGGFGDGAPLSVAVLPDGGVYMTDVDDNGILVRVVDEGALFRVRFDEDIANQPLLAVDRSGKLLALTETGLVLVLEGDNFVPGPELAVVPTAAVDFAVDASNNPVVLLPDAGAVIFDSNGDVLDRVGRVVRDFPLPGELVNPAGVAVDLAGTLYLADSDGTVGSVTAMSTRVLPGRIGATQLIPGLPVQGVLDETQVRQSWTFDGTRGQIVTISAVDVEQTGTFNIALHLLAPDGREAAYNDDQEGEALSGVFDAQIAGHRLAQDGRYTIVVERVDGGGVYHLGLSQDRAFDLTADAPVVLQGDLRDVIPAERWVFQGRAGQVITITMNAMSGTLDPVLSLLDSGGSLLAQNDDAEDPALGPDAELVEIRLPSTGNYTIEAARFDGEGRYQLTITPVS